MANQHNTDLIVRAITQGFDKVANDIHRIGNETERAADGASKGATRWTELQSALSLAETGLRHVSNAARLAWDSLNRGAEIDTIRRKFDRLAESFGTTGDELRSKLHDSIGLLLSDSEQMELALDLMQLGLAKNTEEVARFANVMSQMGMDTGQVVLAIANQSTMRLDQLGIGLERFKENLAAVKEEGYSADTAFSEAFLRSAEETIGVVGSVADTTAGHLATMTSVWQNTKDSFQEEFATTAVSQMEDLMGGAEGVNSALSVMAAQAGIAMGSFVSIMRWALSVALQVINGIASGIAGLLGAIGQIPTDISVFGKSFFNEGQIGLIEAMPGVVETLTTKIEANEVIVDILREGYDAATEGMERFEQASENVVDVTEKQTQVSRDYGSQMSENKELRRAHTKNAEEAAQAEEKLTRSIGRGATVADKAAEAMKALSRATGSYFMQARQSEDFNPVESLLESMEKLGANAQQLAKAGVAGGLFSQDEANSFMAEAATRAQGDQLAQMVMAGMDPAEAAQKIQEIGGSMEENIGLADDFFAQISDDPKVATVSMDTRMAQAQMDTFFQSNETMTVNVQMNTPTGGKDPVERAIEKIGG